MEICNDKDNDACFASGADCSVYKSLGQVKSVVWSIFIGVAWSSLYLWRDYPLLKCTKEITFVAVLVILALC